jgi:hypothetical protein
MSNLKKQLAEYAGDSLLTFIGRTIRRHQRHGEASPQLEEPLGASIISAQRQLGELMRMAIDVGDIAGFLHIDNDWQDLFDDEWWDWHDADASESLSTVISRDRAVRRLALAMWARHKVKRGVDTRHEEQLGQVLRGLDRRFETLDVLFDVLDLAESEANTEGGGWSSWWLSEQPGRLRVVTFATRDELLQTVLLLATRKVPADDGVTQHAWMLRRKADVDRVSAELGRDAEKWGALVLESGADAMLQGDGTTAGEDFAARLERLRLFLDDALRDADDASEQVLREATPSQARIDEFRAEVLSRFVSRRPVRPLVVWRNLAEWIPAEPDDIASLATPYIADKALFVGEQIQGVDFVASNVARFAAIGEMKAFIAAIPAVEPTTSNGEVATAIDAAIVAAAEDDVHVDLIIVPVAWRYRSGVAITPLDENERKALSPSPIPAVTGRIGEAFVIATPEVHDEMLLIEMARAVKWDEWGAPEDAPLNVVVDFFNRETAERYLEARAVGDQEHKETQITRLESAALITLTPQFRVIGREADAVTRLVVGPAI